MGKSKIECKGNMHCMFLENCEVVSNGSVKAETIMNCFISCSQSIELFGYLSKLIGGRYVVGKDIIANTIGSSSNIATELVLGTDPLIITESKNLQNDIENLKSQKTKLSQIITLMNQYKLKNELAPSKEALFENAVNSFEVIKKQIADQTKVLGDLNDKIYNSDKGKVICKNVINCGVKITIGFASMIIMEPINSSIFTKAADDIAVRTDYILILMVVLIYNMIILTSHNNY